MPFGTTALARFRQAESCEFKVLSMVPRAKIQADAITRAFVAPA